MPQARQDAPPASAKPEGERAKPEGDKVIGEVQEPARETTVKINGKDTPRYGITINGETYGTLKKEHADIANDAYTTHKCVELAWMPNGKYKNCVGINVVEDQPPE
jgi:hypothetical protein